MNGNDSLVSVRDLHKSFHGQEVLKGINLHIESHELTVIIGPSGAGKSTFLRCINCLEIFDRGKVVVGSIQLERSSPQSRLDKSFYDSARQLRNSVGMVFQSFNLFPHLTALENIAKAPVVVKNTPQKEAATQAMALLEKVGLASHAYHYPFQLSGGQQQRAAIARALAMSPKVMLYDEPTSALDPGLVEEVLAVMRKLNDEGMTQIVVTHRMQFAREVAHKMAYLDDGQIIEVSTPEQMFTAPADERTKRFLKRFL